MKQNRNSYWRYGLPLLLGVIILPVPLLGNFHIESALLAALVGCFWAGWISCKGIDAAKEDWQRIAFMLQTLYLIGFPLLLFALFTGCFSWNGLGFWVLYPIPSVLFGYAIGRLFRRWHIPYRRFLTVIVLLFVAIGVLWIEFFHLPQVYFFNQVWGGWLGPIYDESIKVGWRLVLFRGMSLAWVSLLWWLPEILKSLKAQIIVAICIALLAFAYTHLPEMGIISPRSYLQEQLGGKKETSHFILYYDKKHYAPGEINYIAKREEFYYQQITDTLELKSRPAVPKIESYFYAHAWQKKALVGAKFTSYVPIWLHQDQLHIGRQQIAGSLKHELVHVLSKQFGNRLFNGSWSIGLTEGLAVALSGNVSPVSTINQIVAAHKPYPTARDIEHSFSPLGFYGGRSAVNYTQSGSFVRYLLQNYPVRDFKLAYRHANIAAAYNEPITKLVKGWHQALDTVSVDSTDRYRAALLYNIPSLLEQKCPHIQSSLAKYWDRSNYFLAEKDTTMALRYLGKAREKSHNHPYIKNKWAYLNLKAGYYKKVQLQASKTDTTVDGLLLDADAFALTGRAERANQFVSQAALIFKKHPDSLKTGALRIRQNPSQWKYYRRLIYRQQSIGDSLFSTLDNHTQARFMRQLIEQKKWDKLEHYAYDALKKGTSPAYFSTYNLLINWEAFKGNTKLAKLWLMKLKSLPLRNRYMERLNSTIKWLHYLKTN